MKEKYFEAVQPIYNEYRLTENIDELHLFILEQFRRKFIDMLWSLIQERKHIAFRLREIEISEDHVHDLTNYMQKVFVIEIIHCKDCAHYKQADRHKVCDVFNTDNLDSKNDFCSYSERKRIKDEIN